MGFFKRADATFARIAAGRTDLGSTTSPPVLRGPCATTAVPLYFTGVRDGDVSAMRFLLANGESLDSISSTIDLECAVHQGTGGCANSSSRTVLM